MRRKRNQNESSEQEPIWGPGWSLYLSADEYPFLIPDQKIYRWYEFLDPRLVLKIWKLRRARKKFWAMHPPGPALSSFEMEDDEDYEEDTTHIEMTFNFLETEAERYRFQALELLRKKKLTTYIEPVNFFYEIRSGGCSSGNSKLREYGIDFDTWTRVRGSRRERLEELAFIFARAEASAKLSGYI